MGLVTLTFDLLTLKLVCESHLRWGTFLPNLGTLGLWVLEVFAMVLQTMTTWSAWFLSIDESFHRERALGLICVCVHVTGRMQFSTRHENVLSQ